MHFRIVCDEKHLNFADFRQSVVILQPKNCYNEKDENLFFYAPTADL